MGSGGVEGAGGDEGDKKINNSKFKIQNSKFKHFKHFRRRFKLRLKLMLHVI
ncbi:hypothetical protein [Nostoc sp. CHAB 5715]|uniref:hypothetical protein n=1 Tax=Nostoc sp. CHAB 5715 TaxID=2780400 RepID=UPI001E3A9A25|nr:hypothetical protein [Nostoc sp. CHAB 5715]MCC5623290.1 hypothetical protein [Nostoc sp. CHAB 5715]